MHGEGVPSCRMDLMESTDETIERFVRKQARSRCRFLIESLVNASVSVSDAPECLGLGLRCPGLDSQHWQFHKNIRKTDDVEDFDELEADLAATAARVDRELKRGKRLPKKQKKAASQRDFSLTRNEFGAVVCTKAPPKSHRPIQSRFREREHVGAGTPQEQTEVAMTVSAHQDARCQEKMEVPRVLFNS